MADQLKRYIYHEKQEPGSALCAQHALNSLLQQPIFTTLDLATIAQGLDSMEQEQSYDTAVRNRARNTNMDDTGFFSVQVLENALQVWGLTLIRWRSQEMQPYQDKPYTRLGFILNLDAHWFTLRRFGPADPDASKDEGIGHWFNLNSFLPDPEWVSRTYLGMVLQQAETEGYSVFVVSQMDPLAPLGLTRTKADEVAATIPDITSGGGRISTSRIATSSSGPSKNTAGEWADVGLEDEDMALQAALYASVMGQPEPAGSSSAPVLPEIARPPSGRQSSDEWDITGARSVFGGARRAPPASTSLARFEEEQMGGFDDPMIDNSSDQMIAGILSQQQGGEGASSSVPRVRPRRQRQEDEEEEEMIRRAIEASKKESKDSKEEEVDDVDMSFEDDEHHGFLDDEDEERELQRLLDQRRRDAIPLIPPIIPPLEPEPFDPFGRVGYDTPFGAPVNSLGTPVLGANAAHLSRTYDDEDEMLQAALKASLEGAPAELVIPPPPKAATRAGSGDAAASTSTSAGAAKKKEEEEEEDEEEDDEEEEEEEEVPEAPKQLTAEEMRKARLARFGG